MRVGGGGGGGSQHPEGRFPVNLDLRDGTINAQILTWAEEKVRRGLGGVTDERASVKPNPLVI